MRWLWAGKIPLGAVTVISGEAGSGKTCLALDLAARVSRGLPFADGAQGPGAGRVLILNADDPVEEQIVPRLVGCGADLEKIAVLSRVAVGDLEGQSRQRRFDLEHDLAGLWEEIESLPDARLVIIDSLESFCGRRGLGRSQLRALLSQLNTLAVECGVAIVVISSEGKCDQPVKNVWRVDCNVLDSDLRYLVPVRCNWGALPAGVAFRVTEDSITWETQWEAPSADRSRGATARQEKSCQLKDHAEWLRACLASGPLTAKDVLAAASEAGLSAGQVRRAREALRVVCAKQTVANGKWVWEMPQRKARDVEGGAGLKIEDVEGGKDVEDAVRELVAA
jgi:RecA-family ATPase